MSNVVKFSITGDTNAEQVAGRAKTAVGGLDKQLEGIGKKFGSSFKDIFLSFLGPMALLGTAMAFIGKMIADNQKKQEDANQAAIDGTNKLMSAEDKYYASKRNNEKKAKETVEEAKTQREETTLQFLLNDPRGKEIYGRENVKYMQGFRGDGITGLPYFRAKENKKIQDEVQALIAGDMKANPLPEVLKASTFSGPQGFSNVVGVGPNAVLEAMTSQLEEVKKTNMILERIAGSSGYTPKDFTKGANNTTAAPSRSYLQTK
jgi:hypothetical protein